MCRSRIARTSSAMRPARPPPDRGLSTASGLERVTIRGNVAQPWGRTFASASLRRRYGSSARPICRPPIRLAGPHWVKSRAVRVFRSVTLRVAPIATALAWIAAAQGGEPRPSPELRWTDRTPAAMVSDAVARARAPGASEHAEAAAIAVIAALAERAPYDAARTALERVAGASEVGLELRGEAALLARMLSPDEGSEAAGRADRALGIVDRVSVLGPFRDNGGGLDAHDGPEAASPGFDPSADDSWGSYKVAWRTVPRAFAGARGIPLDVFVFPRKESCTWVASRLTMARAEPLTLRVAAAGQLRLVVDGVEVARDEGVHEAARFDRIAARVTLAAGEHLVAAKVCSGALDDEGRVRLRVTDDAGGWPGGVTSTPGPWDKGRAFPKAPVARAVLTPLARAIGNGATDVDARLDAAVLRTLGGADDLRSPRAPGLLSALADGAIDADRLAMVAWLAPSGANRGAWLNRARGAADGPRGTSSNAASSSVTSRPSSPTGRWRRCGAATSTRRTTAKRACSMPRWASRSAPRCCVWPPCADSTPS